MADMMGVMLDCSRNGVLRPQQVKKYAELIAKMGYNTLMLYTEDTYEVNNQPYFGYRRGRYTKEELKELDAFCNSIGVTLMPCIQTLAHLNCIFRWQGVYDSVQDIDDILLAGEDGTYQLIDDMFATIAECFSTKDIHIGMDEAYLVGLGEYLRRHGPQKRFDVINNHLKKVCEIARKYDLKPMIWSDMFCKLALNTANYYTQADTAVIAEMPEMPENISLVYWDYYSSDYDRYVRMLKTNLMFNRPVVFAGGAWTWTGFGPKNQYSIDNTAAALRACRDCGVKDIFITIWGDDGSECSMFAVLPALLYAAEARKGEVDIDRLKEKFLEIVGADWDSFMLLDKIQLNNRFDTTLLYSDAFAGLSDWRYDGTEDAYFAALADEIAAQKQVGSFSYMFKKYEMLCRALAIKSDLGIRTRKAYLDGDKAALEKLAKEDYPEAICRIEAFYQAHRTEWLTEKRPQGFEVQDIRLGGVQQRLRSCIATLLSYVSGELSQIEELEEPVLPSDGGTHCWRKLVTAGVISHNVH